MPFPIWNVLYREVFDGDPSTNGFLQSSWILSRWKNPLHNTRSSQTFKEVNTRVISKSLLPTKITEKFILVALFVVLFSRGLQLLK